ncbi:ATP-binding cassette domain-containing protein [Anaeromicropila herbilytica]|uniref:ABC transporter ATP-binding protein n=1 Tax=Anaeromicropila herbilytica TaxID=2785025 RepID=A0A7R7ENN7_9FIRM|nr:ATP-binding cassette domain-containing protein [Anaeromicropila herbilytica]BCN31832.1 ABC transporter ATP-binding protein [Anaeromicropila herbilytica]
MIKVEELTYSISDKELYNDISFTIEAGQHCALIGTSGTGKSTLIEIIRNPERYTYDGKLEITPNSRIGFVSQFSQVNNTSEMTVFEYLSEEFMKMQNEITSICVEMETSSDLDSLLERYQQAFDTFQSMDGDNFESNIMKDLNVANLGKHKDQMLSKLSSGEFKLIQVIKELLTAPNLMIMDEPDVFLDFEHLNALKDLINSHQGAMLVITHNRYLLNHCFNKILHLENTELQEYDGRYIDYNFSLLQKKIELQEQAIAEEEEIERNKEVIDRLRAEATYYTCASRGRALNARVSLLQRLEANRIKEPFVYIKQPEIHFASDNEMEAEEKEEVKVQINDVLNSEIKEEVTSELQEVASEVQNEKKDEIVIKVTDYSVSFREELLRNVNFEIESTDKVALIGPNGTGKTTLLRDIYKNNHASIEISENAKVAFLSQLQGETLNESNTIKDEFIEAGFQTYGEIQSYLNDYGFKDDFMNQKIEALSGGEKNLLQLAKIAANKTNVLLLDEPTSHLDTYSQIALEKAIEEYNGAILMVSHDFYTIANCMDYVLLIEDKTIRKVSIRKFRKMIYANHFDKDYLEIEQKKHEVETKIAVALQKKDFTKAKVLCEKLEELIKLL